RVAQPPQVRLPRLRPVYSSFSKVFGKGVRREEMVSWPPNRPLNSTRKHRNAPNISTLEPWIGAVCGCWSICPDNGDATGPVDPVVFTDESHQRSRGRDRSANAHPA